MKKNWTQTSVVWGNKYRFTVKDNQMIYPALSFVAFISCHGSLVSPTLTLLQFWKLKDQKYLTTEQTSSSCSMYRSKLFHFVDL